MNRLLLTCLCLLPFVAFAQGQLLETLPLENGKVTYSGVVDVDGVSKDELYRRARIWLVDAYRSSKDVLQMEDKENGTLMGKGYLSTSYQYNFMFTYPVNLQHTIRLDFKEGKYRYSITDFIMEYTTPPSQYGRAREIRESIESLPATSGRDKNARKYFVSVDPKVAQTIASMEQALKTTPKAW